MAESLSKAKSLREERAQLCGRMKEITEAPAGEGQTLSAEQRAEFDKLHAKQESLKATIDRIEQQDELEREMAESRGTQGVPQDERGDGTLGKDEDGDDIPRLSEKKKGLNERAFDAYMRYGTAGVTDTKLRSIIQKRYNAPNRMPSSTEVRAQSVGVDTAGGYLVPETFQASVIEAMALWGGMRNARCTILKTSQGGTINIPTDDDTANTGALIGENVATTETSVSFSQVRLNDYTYTSNYVLVSRQLMQDSAIDMGAYITRKFARRLGTITNLHYTTGNGASRPYGVVTQATSGVAAATGQSTTVTTDDLIALEHTVDPVYRNGAQWMFRDSTLKSLKQLKDGEARPIWLPGIAVREPDSILGYNYVINTDVAAMASSAKSILFGDFSAYYIRDVLDMTVLRLEERFAEYFQVAFLAFMRTDGRLVDAGQHPIKYYANSAS